MMVKWSVCSDGRVKVMARADSVVMVVMTLGVKVVVLCGGGW